MTQVREDGAGGILHIDLAAVCHNYRLLRSEVAPARVAAVVKADAYGLGVAEIVGALLGEGCSIFFVAHLDEALALRDLLRDRADLYVLNGLQPGTEARCAEAGAIPVLNSLDQIARWAGHAAACGTRLRGALQVDTGMSRLGLPADELAALARTPERLDGVEIGLVMSHLACADEPAAPANAAQLAAFRAIAERFPGAARSLDNSGGAFHARAHFDLVRAGIALYGGAPCAGAPNPMRPVVSLDARIIQVRDIPAGEGVGYGLTYRPNRAARIATVGVGYADGWSRRLGNRGAAFVGGRRVPVAGRVSMDSLTLDVTDVPAALVRPGATVELLGPHQTIDDVAGDAGTIAYEILTQLGRRYARTYLPPRRAPGPRSACA